MIDVLHHKAPNVGSDQVLLIMLPGVGIEAAAFAEQGMVAAAQAHGLAAGLAIDIIAVQPDLELYLDGDIAAALHQAVIEPALASGYTRLWLLGISLGGMGALLYASAYTQQVEGLILLAPFLGTRGTVAEVSKADGLAAWRPAGSAATEPEKRMLVWLQDMHARALRSPELFLGYGTEDRFAPGHMLLAAVLPEDHVVNATGGHDWETWLTLWRGILGRAPFSRQSGSGK